MSANQNRLLSVSFCLCARVCVFVICVFISFLYFSLSMAFIIVLFYFIQFCFSFAATPPPFFPLQTPAPSPNFLEVTTPTVRLGHYSPSFKMKQVKQQIKYIYIKQIRIYIIAIEIRFQLGNVGQGKMKVHRSQGKSLVYLIYT